mgnify:CR=1 FL=1
MWRDIDRRHAYQLFNLKVDAFNRETADSAISLAIESLKLLGNSKKDAERAGKPKKHDDAHLSNIKLFRSVLLSIMVLPH